MPIFGTNCLALQTEQKEKKHKQKKDASPENSSEDADSDGDKVDVEEVWRQLGSAPKSVFCPQKKTKYSAQTVRSLWVQGQRDKARLLAEAQQATKEAAAALLKVQTETQAKYVLDDSFEDVNFTTLFFKSPENFYDAAECVGKTNTGQHQEYVGHL